MAFVTDLIWRSPLGLRINAQATADVLMTEDWVKVRGDQLVPRDGAYDLRVTAELWETHFFDLVVLLVVDHPEGTEVFVDERFAVPPPALASIATGPVQPFAARARRPRQRRRRGRARRATTGTSTSRAAAPTRASPATTSWRWSCPRPRRAAGRSGSSAQGWVHPTDSSINVALGQGTQPAPRGPVARRSPTRAGRFREVARRPRLPRRARTRRSSSTSRASSPAGGPRRLRLSTNLEIFWDRLGWAVGRPDATVDAAAARARSAELRYRGYSVTEQTGAERRRSGRATRSPARRRAGATSRATTRASAT